MNTIRLLHNKQIPITEIDPDEFAFNPKGRLLFVQRFLFAILRKLKANAYKTSVSIETVEINTSKILNALMQNAADVEDLYRKRARYIVMGARDFARFCSDPSYQNPLYFNFQAPIGFNDRYGTRKEIMGFEVVIVPWIDGFFLLPDLNEERMIRAS